MVYPSLGAMGGKIKTLNLRLKRTGIGNEFYRFNVGAGPQQPTAPGRSGREEKNEKPIPEDDHAMSRKAYPNVNAANQYARHVVAGKIPACQYVIDACQRHIDDLSKSQGKKFRYRFDKDLAEERAARFIQLLPHTKVNGHLKGCLLPLNRQLFIICCALDGFIRQQAAPIQRGLYRNPGKNGSQR